MSGTCQDAWVCSSAVPTVLLVTSRWVPPPHLNTIASSFSGRISSPSLSWETPPPPPRSLANSTGVIGCSPSMDCLPSSATARSLYLGRIDYRRRCDVRPSGRHLSKELPVPIQPKQPTARGPAEWFTGDVWIDAIARGEEPSRGRVSARRFLPAARTAWHAHAVGQTLYVTEGKGLVQSRGGPVEDIRAGDIVATPPGTWHWHGAAPAHYMTHLAITEAPGDDRPEADWGDHVTDDEYTAGR